MKLLNTLLLAITASAVSAAPTATEVDDSMTVPTEAIVGEYALASEEFPVFISQDDQSFVLILNTTVLDTAYDSVSKRDAEASPGWIKFWTGQPINKREADASPGWIKFWTGQPINKRDAQASPGWIKFWTGQPINKRDAEASPGWIKFWTGQPINKREADASPGWIKFWTGQPINKRDAEASPGWIKFWTGQPINKRDAQADAEPWASLVSQFGDAAKRDANADA